MTPGWYRRPLVRGDYGPDVEVLQRRLGLDDTGVLDERTIVYIRGLQRIRNLPVTGEVDDATAVAIGESARAGLPPLWFTRPLSLGDAGADVFALRMVLDIPASWEFDEETEAAIRRLQSKNRLTPDGVLTEQLSLLL